MFDYLQKFNTLPANLRDSVSSPAAMAVISDLETKYKIDLAATVMKVMVKAIPLADLSIYFVSDFSLNQETAKKLTADLKERLFFPVANYLGYNASYSSIVPKTVLAPAHLAGVEKVIKDAGVVFAGVELNSRFRNILTTYIKGIRSRVDARLTLSKDIASGGLGLDYKVIDKIFKAADELSASQTLASGAELALPLNTEPVKTGLDKVRELYEKQEARDIPYDLKTAISSGAIKKPSVPFNLPTPIEASEKLLEKPEEVKPVIVKSVEKIETPITPIVNIPVTPVKPVAPVIPVIPVVPVSPVIPITATVAATVIKSIDAIKPNAPLEPKINRPPEKKVGLFAKLFHTKEAPKVVEQKPVVPKVVPVVSQPSIASLRSEAAIVNKPIVKVNPVQTPVVNVRTAPKVMGPLEELQYLDIINFRRFGTSPLEATAKVESKIKLLEKDGYDKMVSGVLAWRESIVNSIYLKMGLEALTKGISLKQCADTYQANKTSGYLFWEEIEAIIALNSRLMF